MRERTEEMREKKRRESRQRGGGRTRRSDWEEVRDETWTCQTNARFHPGDRCWCEKSTLTFINLCRTYLNPTHHLVLNLEAVELLQLDVSIHNVKFHSHNMAAAVWPV